MVVIQGRSNDNDAENENENENENEDESGAPTRSRSQRPQRERTPAGVTRRVQSEGSGEGGIAPPVTDLTIATALQQLTAVAEGPETRGTTMAAPTPEMAAMTTAVQQLAMMVANLQPTTATGEEPRRSRDRPAPSQRSTRTPAAAGPASDDSPSDSDPESNGESSDPSDSSESGADEAEQDGSSSGGASETDMSDMNDVSDEHNGRA
ncbi:unnamed protein product [Phytophthora fragariaefolia]|uniref:Unnamed protein product n=1 Tax=Phytophthora fragariaefolia TaxID=1490495 RepID=A0A9W7CY00_9STRA|nr:unnamed protein product [Phytophthora fragariaefolia]